MTQSSRSAQTFSAEKLYEPINYQTSAIKNKDHEVPCTQARQFIYLSEKDTLKPSPFKQLKSNENNSIQFTQIDRVNE